MPRSRHSLRRALRRLPIALAVLAVIGGTVASTWWLFRTSEAYQQRADEHARKAAEHESNRSAAASTWSVQEARLADYHSRMNQKWEYAASHPWLSVEPDPPRPK